LPEELQTWAEAIVITGEIAANNGASLECLLWSFSIQVDAAVLRTFG